MDISIVFPFLEPSVVLLWLPGAIVLIVYCILLFYSSRKYDREYKFSKGMQISTLIALFLIIGFFFIPSIGATNITSEDQAVLNLIFTLTDSLMQIPLFLLLGVILIIFGWLNREKYNYYLFAAGILITVPLIWNYIDSIFFTWNIIDYSNYNAPLTIFYLNVAPILFTIIKFLAYASFIIHGIINKQSSFRNLGLIMIAIGLIAIFIQPYLNYIILGIY